MACIKFPIPEAPQLPSPFTIPKFNFELPDLPDGICCKLPPIPIPELPKFIPPAAIDPAIIAVINGGIKAIRDYVDLQPLNCPKE